MSLVFNDVAFFHSMTQTPISHQLTRWCFTPVPSAVFTFSCVTTMVSHYPMQSSTAIFWTPWWAHLSAPILLLRFTPLDFLVSLEEVNRGYIFLSTLDERVNKHEILLTTCTAAFLLLQDGIFLLLKLAIPAVCGKSKKPIGSNWWCHKQRWRHTV